MIQDIPYSAEASLIYCRSRWVFSTPWKGSGDPALEAQSPAPQFLYRWGSRY